MDTQDFFLLDFSLFKVELQNAIYIYKTDCEVIYGIETPSKIRQSQVLMLSHQSSSTIRKHITAIILHIDSNHPDRLEDLEIWQLEWQRYPKSVISVTQIIPIVKFLNLRYSLDFQDEIEPNQSIGSNLFELEVHLDGRESHSLLFYTKENRDQLVWSILRLYERIKVKSPLTQNIDLHHLHQNAIDKNWGSFHEWLEIEPSHKGQNLTTKFEGFRDERILKIEQEQQQPEGDRLEKSSNFLERFQGIPVQQYSSKLKDFEDSFQGELRAMRTTLINTLTDNEKQVEGLKQIHAGTVNLLEGFLKHSKWHERNIKKLRGKIDNLEKEDKISLIKAQNKKALIAEIKHIADDLIFQDQEVAQFKKFTLSPKTEKIQLSKMKVTMQKIISLTQPTSKLPELDIVAKAKETAKILKKGITSSLSKQLAKMISGFHNAAPSTANLKFFQTILLKNKDILMQLFEIMEQNPVDAILNLPSSNKSLSSECEREWAVAWQKTLKPFSLKFDKFIHTQNYPAAHGKMQNEVLSYLIMLLQYLEAICQIWLRFFQTKDTPMKRQDIEFRNFFEQMYRSFFNLSQFWVQSVSKKNPCVIIPLHISLQAIVTTYKGFQTQLSFYDHQEQNSVSMKLPEPCNFKLKLLDAYQVETGEAIKRFQSVQRTSLEGYVLNIRYAGVLEPTHRFFALMEYLILISPSTANLELQIEELFGIIVRWLEKVATTKEKYSDLVLMENYHYLATQINRKGETVKHHAKSMQKHYQHHRGRYLKWHFEKQMTSFAQFYCKLKSMLKQIKSEELQFQLGFRSQDFQKEVKLGFGKFESTFSKMCARVAKHLRHNEVLLQDMLKGLREFILTEFKIIEQIAKNCYKLHKLYPGLEEINSAIKSSSYSKFVKE